MADNEKGRKQEVAYPILHLCFLKFILLWDKSSRDGVCNPLFPLSAIPTSPFISFVTIPTSNGKSCALPKCVYGIKFKCRRKCPCMARVIKTYIALLSLVYWAG